MTPEALLEKLESLGTIDAKVLKKLRRTIENPEKDSSVNKILTFLVKNDFLSKQQAKELKREPDPVPVVDNLTDDLTAGVLSSSSQAVVEEVEQVEEVHALADFEEEVAEVVEVHGEPEVIVDGFDPDIAETVIQEPAAPLLDDLQNYADPMAAPLDQFSDSKVNKRTFCWQDRFQRPVGDEVDLYRVFDAWILIDCGHPVVLLPVDDLGGRAFRSSDSEF